MAVLADELLADFADAEPSGAPRVLLAGCWALAALSRSDQGRDFVCAPPLSIAAASQLVTRGMGLEAPPAPDPGLTPPSVGEKLPRAAPKLCRACQLLIASSFFFAARFFT